MRKEWVWLIGLSVCIVFIIPWSVLRWQKEKVVTKDVQIRILRPSGVVTKLPLEEYLVGVVAAEMPAEFELEALKAQAVAARTYAVRRLSSVHQQDGGYDVDTTVQTQAWLSAAQMRNKWGWFNYWRYRGKLQKAVTETQGMVLVAKGEYIEAYYHSSSGRKPTERSEDVWGSPRSYLQNVSSGEENQQRYIKSLIYTPQELYKKLGIERLVTPFKADDFQMIDKTAAGRAKNVRILGKAYPATQLRNILGLSSTDIEWAVQPERVTITTYGNGHAVGMSQWGANDLAKQLQKFEEILTHFYPGAKLLKLGYKQ